MDFALDMKIDKLSFDLPFIFIYGDDILSAASVEEIYVALNTFKSINIRPKFMIVPEKDNSVCLLDTLVVRSHKNKIILN